MSSEAPMFATEARVLEHVPIARDTYRLRLECPDIARTIRPGQFVMVRPSSGSDPLLGRPFALYEVACDTGGWPQAIDIVYLVLGRGTAALAERRQGERLRVWGPLGNGFRAPPAGEALFVAGGIGQTPFLALARWWTGQAHYGVTPLPDTPRSSAISLLYGTRTAEYLAGLHDFQAAGVEVELATNDGSAGHRGYVTDLLERRLDQGRRPSIVVGCGPTPMLTVLAGLLLRHAMPGLLSLENHMACGFGACFSCVTRIREPGGSTDLKRVCIEGPVFDARDVVL